MGFQEIESNHENKFEVTRKKKRKKERERTKKKKWIQHHTVPGWSPTPVLSGSNRVNFGVRMRTGALRLIWSNPEILKSTADMTQHAKTIISKKKVIRSRFVRVILAQGPC